MRTRHGLGLAISLLLLAGAPGAALASGMCECNDGQIVSVDDVEECDMACEDMGGGQPATLVNPNADEESEANRASAADEPSAEPEQKPGPNRKP